MLPLSHFIAAVRDVVIDDKHAWSEAGNLAVVAAWGLLGAVVAAAALSLGAAGTLERLAVYQLPCAASLLAGFVLAALAAASSSAAPRLSVTLAAPPSGLRAATAWTATVTVRKGGKPLAGAGPVLTFRNGLTARTVTTAPAGKRGSYRARLALPFAGHVDTPRRR